MQINFYQLFHLIGGTQGLLLAILVFKKRKENISGILLSVALVIISLRLLIFPFKNSETIEIQILSDLTLTGLLLFGPLMFLFLKIQSPSRRLLKLVDLSHSIPFILYLAFDIFDIPQNILCKSYAVLYSSMIYGGIMMLGYWILSRKDVKLSQSKNYVFSFAIPLILIPAMIYGTVNLSWDLFGFHPATIPYLILSLLIYRLGFKAMLNSKLFLRQLTLPKLGISIVGDLNKSNYPELMPLLEIMEKEKYFLDENLTLDMLAKASSMKSHQLSSLINNHLGGFNEFINSFRIEAAKEKLCNGRADFLSIDGIAEESGFKSKSTFYEVFKKNTGMTPSAFKNLKRQSNPNL